MSNLTPRSAWSAVAARLEAVERMSSIYAGFLGNTNAKTLAGADEAIHVSCIAVWDDMLRFRREFGGVVAAADAALDRFTVGNSIDTIRGYGSDFNRTRVLVLKLIALGAEVSHALHDRSEQIRLASELAFQHLQRLIVVDTELRQKWADAFKAGETHCEKIGAAHLLWHGILAFKVDATGGRTNLVYQEPVHEEDLAGVRGLVLTEWKVAHRNGAHEFGAAEEQAENYATGVLGGLELASHRYLVVVSEKQVRLPPDKVRKSVTYRHINIAVDPESPSKAAQRLARQNVSGARASDVH